MLWKTRSPLAICCVAVSLGCVSDPVNSGRYGSQPESVIEVHLIAKSEADVKTWLAGFSNRHGYRLCVARTHPTEPSFSISMWRPDSMILGTNSFDLEQYHFFIYPALSGAPSDADLNDLLHDLQTDLTRE